MNTMTADQRIRQEALRAAARIAAARAAAGAGRNDSNDVIMLAERFARWVQNGG